MGEGPIHLVATPSQTVGPYFKIGLADNAVLGCLVSEDTRGERIKVRIRVLDGDGSPIPDALVELWQADADGVYVRPADPRNALTPTGFCGFGRLATGNDGACEFTTIRPGSVRDAQDRPQAHHVNICLFARGLLRQVFTRFYFAGDPLLASDAVLASVPEGRRHTLVAGKMASGEWLFEIRMQGQGETVFFDL